MVQTTRVLFPVEHTNKCAYFNVCVCVCVSERRKERGKEREKEAPAKPRPLHLTTSLFIRSIPPEVSKEEITAVRAHTHLNTHLYTHTCTHICKALY